MTAQPDLHGVNKEKMNLGRVRLHDHLCSSSQQYRGILKKGGLGHADSQAAPATVERRKKGRVVLAAEGQERELQALSRAARL